MVGWLPCGFKITCTVHAPVPIFQSVLSPGWPRTVLQQLRSRERWREVRGQVRREVEVPPLGTGSW